ncbi:hypothetical protein TRFO_19918 [Tritrichomonas foetus]|uniref:Uncharacterized protein n=1 Tax=Tritrichomonas foetus TaxID=1144522 RepID=A0A1J4KLU3_9EUKA|nr:hypothetical protein TRFO_19918 [Tritrichomonas foetus]|eukprot:OHT10772.1 hypothetical protein TRFO_19918 [Tritrichomonas foetus]
MARNEDFRGNYSPPEGGFSKTVQRLCIGSPDNLSPKQSQFNYAIQPKNCLSPTKPLKFGSLANANQKPTGFHQPTVRSSVKWNRKQGIQAGIQKLGQTIIQNDALNEIIREQKKSPPKKEIHEPRKKLVTFNTENIKYGQLSNTFHQGQNLSQHPLSPPIKHKDTFVDLPNSQNVDPNSDRNSIFRELSL